MPTDGAGDGDGGRWRDCWCGVERELVKVGDVRCTFRSCKLKLYEFMFCKFWFWTFGLCKFMVCKFALCFVVL